MNILGVDCSTTTIGLTLLTDGRLSAMDYVKPEGETLFAKVLNAEVAIRKVWHYWRCPVIDQIVVERPIRFASGGSSANTVFVLNWFNGAIWTILWQNFGLVPAEFSPETARKITIGIGRFPKGTNTKEAVFDWVDKRLTQEKVVPDWPVNKRGRPAVERYDMADSYIVALAAYLKEKEPVVVQEAPPIRRKRSRRAKPEKLVEFK